MELCLCTVCHYCTIYNLCNHHWGRDLHYHHRNSSTRRITSRTSGITLYCVKLCRRLLRCHNCITIHNAAAAARTLPPMHQAIVMRCNFPCKWVTAWLARLDGWMDSERDQRQWCDSRVSNNNNNITISLNGWLRNMHYKTGRSSFAVHTNSDNGQAGN